MKLKFLVMLVTLSAFGPVHGQLRNVDIESTPEWVKPVSFNAEAIPPAGQESGYYYLLIDEQENTPRQERYQHFAYKVITNEGIQAMSDITVEFDPAYQRLIFHNVSVHRNGKVINQLKRNIRTIQREESMDRYLYDGSLTAIINLTDVRTGDIIEYSFTRKGYNPVLGGHISRKIYLNFSLPYEQFYQRLIVPESLPLDMEYRLADIKPEISTSAGQTEYIWSLKAVKGALMDNNLPYWYDGYQRVMITDFNDWKEVAAWGTAHFETSSDSRERIRALTDTLFESTDDELTGAMKAIRFVQDDIRYLGFESGLNSHKPHPPDKVLDQRFGDCKDKSLLLCEILRIRNIEAYPVLVNTVLRDKITDELPSITAFNHCVVQLEVNGRSYYVDPTIGNQGGPLDSYAFPSYGKGLVLNGQTTDLIEFPAPPISEISEVQTFEVADLHGEAMLNIRTTYTGSEADNIRGQFASNSLESAQKSYQNYYANMYPDLQVAEPLAIHDNRESNIFTVEENYKISTFWQQSEAADDQMYCEVYPQTLENYFNVNKSTERTAPYALAYPVSYHHIIHIRLPQEWNVEPDNEIIETDFYEYEYLTRYSNREITIQTHYETNQNHVPVEAFEQFVSDHGKMMNNLGFQLSYNKNAMNNQSGISWMAISVALLSLGFGIWGALRIFYYYDPAPAYSSAEGLPIGGWLILPAFGLCITPLRLIYDLFTMPEVYDSQTWSNLLALERYGLYVFIFIEHVYNLVLIPFSVLVLVLFIKRRSSLPRLITIFYAVTCFVTIADMIAGAQLGSDTDQQAYSQSMVRSVIVAVIWIPYFNISKRVKETFVKRVNDDDNESVYAAGVTEPLTAPERVDGSPS